MKKDDCITEMNDLKAVRDASVVEIGYGEITSHAISSAMQEAVGYHIITAEAARWITQRFDHIVVELFRGQALTMQGDGSYIQTEVVYKTQK